MKTYNQFLETPIKEAVKYYKGDDRDPTTGLPKGLKPDRKRPGEKPMTAPPYNLAKNEEVVHEGDYHSGQGEKIQKRTKKWMDKKGQKGAPGLDAMKARTAEHKAKRGEKRHPRDQKELDKAQAFIKKNPNFGKVSEGTDKAFEYVKKQIAAKYGKSGYVSKDNPRKPQTDADKAKVRAHQAKVDKENAAARAKDPSQGRYPKG